MMHKSPIRMLRATLVALTITLCGGASAQLATNNNGARTAQAEVGFPAPVEHKDAKLTARIIDAPYGTFGYEVLSDNKLFVRQTNVPGRPGNSGCPTKEQAEKLSILVIGKIQRGEMPPTVTQHELKALGLIH